ncbi:MAG: PBP1A family penicillin-binding protein [Rhizobiales bacterium]|nr:PBP1A family penicillin-binding protein [Hyphomicrobiales bacterium]NRB13398.1 PBP1A family penicillin-binding protein [Hyphomicrobiales bacterium]
MTIKQQTLNFLLKIDSAMDNFVYRGFVWLKLCWSNYAHFMTFARVRGVKRFTIELISDGLTLAFVMLVSMFLLGQYALVDVSEGWKLYQKYSVSFYDKNDKFLGRRGIRHDLNVPLEELPNHMVLAVLATEDRSFYDHIGVDPFGIVRALIRNIKKTSGTNQGASTITQQLARDLFFTAEQTIERKIKEAYMAVWLESNLTKNEILSLYFDRAYMGAGNFGLEAASQYYFGKSVREVDLPQAAMLAGILKSPTNYSPHLNLAASRARANVVLTNMVNAGFLNHGDVFDARSEPASIVNRHSPDNKGEYFLDWVYENAKKLAKGKSYMLNVKTTIDLDLQDRARQTIKDSLNENGKAFQVDQASLVSMEYDGAVLALIGGKDYSESQFNRATSASRQPGSAFKPIVFLTALDNGYRPDTEVEDSSVRIKNWSPKNYNRKYIGKTTVNEALVKSINTVSVKLALDVGYDTVIATAKKLGIDAEMNPNASLPLGTSAMSVLDLTGAYATIANGGTLSQPYGITEIRSRAGELIYSRARDEYAPNVVFDPHKVADLKYMLGNVVEHGTGKRANLGFTKTYGKTGTTQSYRDAWFMGFTDHLVTGVWFGNDNYTPTIELTGGTLPAMAFNSFMTKAYESKYAYNSVTRDYKAAANLTTPYNAKVSSVKVASSFINQKAKKPSGTIMRNNNIITISSNNVDAGLPKSVIIFNGKTLTPSKPIKRPKLPNATELTASSIRLQAIARGATAYIDASGKIVILHQ